MGDIRPINNSKLACLSTANGRQGLFLVDRLSAHTEHAPPCDAAINVPEQRVRHFVTRKQISEEIDNWLQGESNELIVVLLGMGGSGKTQLALECCQRAGANPDFATVIWIDATSPNSVQQSYIAIASKLTGASESIVDSEKNMVIVEEALRERQAR